MNQTTAPATPSEFALPKLTQAELNDIIRKHQMFLTGRPGGARAVLRDHDLSQLSFVGQNLSQSDFTGCIMSNVDFKGANFESATLFGCDLSSSKLGNAKLARADLRGADIQNADLDGADLSNADLREGKSILKRKIKSAEDMGHLASTSAPTNFSGSNLSNVILTGAQAANADFSDVVLTGAKMNKIDLKGALLAGADLGHVDLSSADIRDADFSYTTMTGADISHTEKNGANFTLVLTGDTIGKDIGEYDLTLDELVLRHMSWVATAGRQGVQMTLEKTDMRKGAAMASRQMTALKAIHCTFAEMDLRGIEMQGAHLEGSDFRKAKLNNSDLRGSSFNNIIGMRANFAQSDMNPLYFKRDDGMSYALPCRFAGAQLRHAIFRGARLKESVFSDADLTGCDFRDCDLRKADFKGAILTYASFDGALIEGADFSGAKGFQKP